MRRLAFLLAALAVLAPPTLAFEPGDDVSYTAGGADSLSSDVDALRADPVSLEGAVDQLEQREAAREAEEPFPASSVVYVAPAEGAKVSGVTPVRVRVPTGTDWIGVYSGYCPGNTIGEDQVPDANGEYEVEWDTTLCQNGQQDLDTFAFSDDGTNLGSGTIRVKIDNEAAPPLPPPAPAPPAEEPGPIVGQGYSRVFDDEFATLDRSTWCSHQWWEPPPPLGTQYVQDGVLHVVSRRSDGYPNNTITSEPCGQANPKSFKQGYFEARFKSTNGRGSMPAFWLFSTRHAANPAWPNINPVCAQQGLPRAECLVSELDIQEGHEGVYPYPRGSQIFAGALHRNTGDMYGGGENQFRQVFVDTHPINFGGAYHVYAAKWTMSQVCWYLDEVQQGCQPTYDSTNQPMHMLFYQWPNSWGALTPDSTTPDELHIEVDWVRVWVQTSSSTPGATPAPGSPTAPVLDTTAPRLRIGVKTGAPLARTLRRGLLVNVTCSEPCQPRVRAAIDRRTARRLHLGKGKSPVVVGRSVRSIRPAVRHRLRVKFGRRAKRALHAVSKIRLALGIRATDAVGNVSVATRKVRLVK